MKKYYCLANKDNKGNYWNIVYWIGESCERLECKWVLIVEVKENENPVL
jgi:hypothetical protein